MAGLFPSFMGSSMPKRLLRYALSRLDLLDAQALDLENLDLALGRNTILEFRDVGIQLPKLESLLSLPPTFRIDKAKVLVLRVTIPMDFYNSPISIEVDGVDIAVRVETSEAKSHSHEPSMVVPNTVDLAQSFLESEPQSEKRKLEDAIAAENLDLAASIAESDEGSEDEPALGTGAPLSLPNFLADFLQGIIDRMQISIKGVEFQLKMEIPQESNSAYLEPISFKIALENISIEGLTTQLPDSEQQQPTIVHKEGKRNITIANVRAYLISEANLFPSLSRSPSMASPALSSSSAAFSRLQASREPSSLSEMFQKSSALISQHDDTEDHSVQLQQDDEDDKDADEPDEIYSQPLGDSEIALGIPYELSGNDEDALNEEPSTPRASVYHELSGESSQQLPSFSLHGLDSSARLESSGISGSVMNELFKSQASTSMSISAAELEGPAPVVSTEDAVNKKLSIPDEFSDASEDLSESRLYSHEEAASMYMSALSTTTTRDAPIAVTAAAAASEEEVITELPKDKAEEVGTITAADAKAAPSFTMPGAWGEESSLVESSLANDQNPTSSSLSIALEEPKQADSPSISTETDTTGLVEPGHMDGAEADADIDAEAEKDNIPTPKGPTRVMKEILHFDSVSVYIPSRRRDSLVTPESLAKGHEESKSMYQSVYPQAPGAFSIHGQYNTSLPVERQSEKKDPQLPMEPTEVHVSPIVINFDASLAFLLATVVNKLIAALRPQREEKSKTVESPNPTDSSANNNTPPIKIAIEEISLNFLSRLVGVADRPNRRGRQPSTSIFEQEVLLNLTLGHIAVDRSQVTRSPAKGSNLPQVAALTSLNIRKFRFGYASGDMMSFDASRPMSTSIRDTFLSTGHDIAIKMTQTAEDMRVEVETLPIVIQIELQRLDETFSWFGGLSSFLNMSASVAIASPGSKSSVMPQTKPRCVHFDTLIDPEDKSTASSNKINVRIGGAYLELLGKECSVIAETNAIKLVSRDEGVGIACSLMKISGPYLVASSSSSSSEPPINIDIGGIRLDFLTSPKATDLEKLLELIIPSKVKYDHTTDEIMVDTLLRQRRKGSVLRVAVDAINIRVKNLAQLAVLPNLGEELAKLSTVAKYLPEDDRPGLLTLAKVQRLSASIDIGKGIGHIGGELKEVEVAQITVPSLIAVVAQSITVTRNKTEELISSSTYAPRRDISARAPALMARMIGDEIEPTIKLKLHDVLVEYRVPTIMDLLGLADDATPQDFEDSLAASVANLGDHAHAALARQQPSTSPSRPAAAKQAKPMKVNIGFQDCLIGLNPLKLESKMVIALTDAHLEVTLPNEGVMRTVFAITKASVLLTDDASQLLQETLPTTTPRGRASASASAKVGDLCARGFVDICYISSATAVLNIKPGADGQDQIQVELRDDLLVLETCADSTQTLITLANALKPPTPPTKENRYRTNVVPVQDLLASISAEAFGQSEGDYDFDQDFAGAQEMAGSISEASYDGNDGSLRVESQFYDDEDVAEELFDATKASGISDGTAAMEDTQDGVLLTGFDHQASQNSIDSDDLIIHDNFFTPAPIKDDTIKVWNSGKNTYDSATASLIKRCPVKVSVRDVHVIWNLFDGYDWAHTRDEISKAVHEVENRAFERQAKHGQAFEDDEEDETIGDFLFNSIYIGIPANRDPQELSRAINEGLNDNATETESVATTAFTNMTGKTARRLQPRPKRLRLNRSKHHKITFELQGVDVDMVMFPPDLGETISSIDVRVQNLDIFDHVPTSTWKKFATYDQDQGEREMGKSMVHLEILTVKPLPQLGASEFVVRVTVLPLRLHVDQDALDFITRFFEFKDDKVPVHSSPSDVPFVQRAEVHSIPVKLDFKPKRVDYAGLRSGHTTEFMNFIVLEESRMVLRHAIIYGTPGFDRLGQTLNDIWMPDVRGNQLPGVIAGLAPVRSLVNIGSGFRDLVEIPIREYQKDGRIVRSISKGAAAFARSTGTELVKFGAKLAVGTQYALQGAEDLLANKAQNESGWDDDELDEDDKKQISLYADQPTGVMQGIRGGYRSLVRDMNVARDAIIAVPGEVMDSQSAAGAARAVLKRAPTIIFRPAMGVTKVVGQTLMGATNAIDPQNRRRIEEKYKH